MDIIEAKPRSTFRPRRPHKKSRNGCLRCKKEKRKCDELQPRCTRCEKRNVLCVKSEARERRVKEDANHYPTLAKIVEHAALNLDVHPGPSNLDPAESELFSHYLEHTARSVAADSADLYALGTEIRRLVSESRIIMHSVLALAAIHKCSTIIQDPNHRQNNYTSVTHLLHTAEQYHREVLQQAQSDVEHMRRYDHVMLNAALMVLYSCASHSVQISLMGGGAGNAYMPGSFRPGDLQWFSMIRAIQSAYSGLANTKPESLDGDDLKNPHQEQIYSVDMPRSPLDEIDLSGASGPTIRTRRLFLPIVAATWNGALDRLDATAERIQTSELPGAKEVLEYQMCTQALRLLRSIFMEVFTARTFSQASSPNSDGNPGPAKHSKVDEIAKLEPWLRDYLARITSKAPHLPLRRTIMAFVHRLPNGYTELVQNAIDVTSQNHDVDDGVKNSLLCSIEKLSLQRLAVDIFAHWLVLVMLLDGIWWIGDIGTWELEQAISAMSLLNRLDRSPYLCGWWPSSMYITKLEIDQHEIRDLD